MRHPSACTNITKLLTTSGLCFFFTRDTQFTENNTSTAAIPKLGCLFHVPVFRNWEEVDASGSIVPLLDTGGGVFFEFDNSEMKIQGV